MATSSRAAEAAALARAGLGFGTGTDDPELDALLDDALARLRPAAAADRASDRAAAVADYPALAATAHLVWRIAHGQRDRLSERIDVDRAALEQAERARNPHLELNALLYGISDLTEAGHVDAAARWFERFHRRAAEVREPVYESFARSMEATAHLMRGNYAIVDSSRRRSARDRTVDARSTRARGVAREPSRVCLGPRAARRLRRGRVVHGRRLREPVDVGRVRSVLPLGRRPGGTRAVLLDAVVRDDGVAVDDDSLWAAGLAILVEMAKALPDRRAGARLASATRPYADRMVVCGLARATLGPMARYAGVAEHLAGDQDGADELLARAERRCRDLHARPHLARTLHDRALVFEARGHRDDAAHACVARAEAREIAADLGVTLEDLVTVGRP